MGVSEEPPGETNEDDPDAVGDEVDRVEELEKEVARLVQDGADKAKIAAAQERYNAAKEGKAMANKLINMLEEDRIAA